MESILKQANRREGLCPVFVRHIRQPARSGNADRAVLADLEHWLAKFVGDGDPMFTHRAEGPDDMAAHSSSADSDLSECSLCQSPIDVRYLARDLFVRASVPATYS